MQKPEMKKCNGHEYSYSLTCGGCHKAKGYNQGLQAGLAYREMNWIKCEDRLPVELIGKNNIGYGWSQDVLAFSNNDILISSYDYDKHEWLNEDDFDLNVTHWMPLPEAPKAEGEGK